MGSSLNAEALGKLNAETLGESIARYKECLGSEKWKTACDQGLALWKAVGTFQREWDLDADDFGAMFKKVYENLRKDYTDISGFGDEIQRDAEQIRELFRSLSNDTLPMMDRIYFAEPKPMDDRKDKLKAPNLSRYLWFLFPDELYPYNYTIMKEKICKPYQFPKWYWNDISLVTLELYQHFCAVIHDILVQDRELICQIQDYLDENCYQDPKFHVLTYDFLCSP